MEDYEDGKVPSHATEMVLKAENFLKINFSNITLYICFSQLDLLQLHVGWNLCV